MMIGASCLDIRLTAETDVEGTTEKYPYYTNRMPSYYTGLISRVDDKEFETLLGTAIPYGKSSGELTVNDAVCQMYYAKSPIARFAYRKLTKMKKKSEEAGKPDLNILFIYNMPFRAIAKMTGGMCRCRGRKGRDRSCKSGKYDCPGSFRRRKRMRRRRL